MLRTIKPTLMLAEFAQILPTGSVNILGGGLTVLHHQMPRMFIAGTLEFGWEGLGQSHSFQFELLDDQGLAVTDDAGAPVGFGGPLDFVPRAGIKKGTPLAGPIAIPLGALPLSPNGRYEWRYEIDGETHEDWTLGFSTLPEAQSLAA